MIGQRTVSAGVALVSALFAVMSPAAAQPNTGLSIGVTAGGAGVQTRRVAGAPWEFGPMFGARARWQGTRTAASLTIDVQPFLVPAIQSTSKFRAAYFLPFYGVEFGSGGIAAGLGAAVFRFTDAVPKRTEYGFVTGASGYFRLPASFSLELGWRTATSVRGVRPVTFSLQLARFWRI
jgi:hypothetical protein